MFQVCKKCGRFAAVDVEALAELPAEDPAHEVAARFQGEGHDLLTFDEQPPGWPDQVEGVLPNGHKAGTFNGRRRCTRDGEEWPCSKYVEAAGDCPGSKL